MTRAPSPKPPTPPLDGEDIELTPHFSEPPKPKKTRAPRKKSESTEPKPKKAKTQSDAAPKRSRKSSTPKKKAEPALEGSDPKDEERAAEVPANDLAPAVRPSYADVMPYHPSVPCAACATGVDPLRAASVRATERGLEFFCSRDCREAHRHNELERARRVEAPPPVDAKPIVAPTLRPVLPSVPPSRPAPRSLEPVARRIAPGRPTTPIWPWLAAFLGAALPLVRLPYVIPASALLITATAAAFISRSGASREQAGMLGWLSPALAIACLSLAAVLGDVAHGQVWLAAAALGLIVVWSREHWLERAHAASAALRAELEARSAARVRVFSQDGRLQERPLTSLLLGDHVWLEQGSVVPVDGVVVEGEAELLPYPQARLTITRRAGGAVLAGALMISGSLRVRATAVGPKRALFRALSERQLSSPSLQTAARAQAFGPLALALVAAAAILPPGTLSTKLAGLGAALLVLPFLASARGILAALQGAIIRAAGRGVLFRDGAALERAGQVDTAVLRVEGTLVPRSYTLVEVHALTPELNGDALLAWARAVESAAEGHPIARAIRKYAETFGIEAPVARRMSYARGAGVSGFTDGQGAVVLGSRAALLQAGVSVAVADREAQAAEHDGHKVVLIALGGHVRGLFVFAQELRTEARVAVQSLFDLGLEVELVSGDHRNTVEALARTLDVLQAKAELGREQREAEVRRLRDGEARVVAIGNAEDAGGMLTAADVGMCLEGAPEVHTPGDLRAIAYDVITASADLNDAAYALRTARETRRALLLVWALSGSAALLALLGALSLLPAWLCALAGLLIDAACLAPRNLRARETLS